MFVLRLMLNGRLTLSEMARELHVHARTIRRDLEALEEAHLPVVSEYSCRTLAPIGASLLERCPICLTQVKRTAVTLELLSDDD
jgi:DNA-binding HxlR family transcriptional regulator